MRNIPVYRSLTSYLVPESQSFEDTELKAKKCRHETRKSIETNQNQSKLIKSVTSHTLLVDLMNS